MNWSLRRKPEHGVRERGERRSFRVRRTSGKKVIKSAVGEGVGERHEEIAAVLRKVWETTHRHRERAGVNLEPRCQAGFSSAGSNYQIKSAHISLLLSGRFHALNLPTVVPRESGGLMGLRVGWTRVQSSCLHSDASVHLLPNSCGRGIYTF